VALRPARWAIVAILAVAGACSSSGGKQAVLVPVAPPPYSVDQLLAHLDAAEPTTRADAAWLLAGAKDLGPDGVARLKRAMADGNMAVRSAAVWALSHAAPVDQLPVSDEPPKLIRQTKPLFPADAYSKRLQGTVDVELLVDEEGNVARAEVRKSIPEFDAAALACVREWHFQPAKLRGAPIAVVARAPVTFRIY
jgi:TonB family protein